MIKNELDGSHSIVTIYEEENLAIIMIAIIVVTSMQPSIRYFVTIEKKVVGEGKFYLSDAIDVFNSLQKYQEES